MGGATPGVYHLVVRLRTSRTLQIGRLGRFRFPAGYCIYTGSARNGLEHRLARHRCTQKKLHWHIDYLLRAAQLVDVVAFPTRTRAECARNRRLLSLPGAAVPVTGFGSSDCRCAAHLVYFSGRPTLPSRTAGARS
jgi:Uri superfamily endonuclease